MTDGLNDLTISPSVNSETSNPTVLDKTLPKVTSTVLYHNSYHNSWNKALIISRAAKAKGKNNSWFTINYITRDEHISINFSKIKGWKNIEDEVLIVTPSDHNVEILEAKQTELNSWIKYNVYEEVEDRGQNVVSVRWIISQKFKDNEMKYKARLVARRFEVDNLNSIRKDSPTYCKDNFRLTLSIIISNKWTVRSVDVKSAFLQGKGIDRDVYLKPPKELGTKKLWKLKTTVYGLCDAPRVWYISVKKFFWRLGLRKVSLMTQSFSGIGMVKYKDWFAVMLILFWGGTNNFEKTVIQKLKESFVTSPEEFESFKYLFKT